MNLKNKMPKLDADMLFHISRFMIDDHFLYYALTSKEFYANLQKRGYVKTTKVGPELLQFAVSQGYRMTLRTSHMLAASGNLPLLQWAFAHGCPWNEGSMSIAVSYGHLNLLQWLHAEGYPVCGTYFAAASNQLRILQWMREIKCAWDDDTAEIAAEYGFLTLLKWALAHGCPWDESMLNAAVEADQREVVEWLQGNGYCC